MTPCCLAEFEPRSSVLRHYSDGSVHSLRTRYRVKELYTVDEARCRHRACGSNCILGRQPEGKEGHGHNGPIEQLPALAALGEDRIG